MGAGWFAERLQRIYVKIFTNKTYNYCLICRINKYPIWQMAYQRFVQIFKFKQIFKCKFCMDISIIISVSAVICTICGWFATHRMAQKRDFANKKKEIRISYLVDAYQRIGDTAYRENNDKLFQLEDAIANIQLFGTKRQVELARKFIAEFEHTNHADITPLLKNLRDDLRNELNLEDLNDERWICFRIRNNKAN